MVAILPTTQDIEHLLREDEKQNHWLVSRHHEKKDFPKNPPPYYNRISENITKAAVKDYRRQEGK